MTVSQRMHQIGEVADATGLSFRTIRYYGEVGLVEPSGRSAGGFRLYTDDDIARLRFIKETKPLNFALEEMRELLAVRDELESDSANPARRAELLDRLAMFTEAAEERCARLRDELAMAESFAGNLQQAFTHYRPAADPPPP